MNTIREIIESYRQEVLGDLLPERASVILKDLSSLLGNILAEITLRDMEYNKHLLMCLEGQKQATRAKITAETSDEYRLMREARNAEKVALSMIGSLKYFLREKENEMKQGKNV